VTAVPVTQLSRRLSNPGQESAVLH